MEKNNKLTTVRPSFVIYSRVFDIYLREHTTSDVLWCEYAQLYVHKYTIYL